MSYSIEDISDLKDNLASYPGIEYVGDIEPSDGEILSYWRPTIGLYKGFAQIDIKGDFFDAAYKASELLWNKINIICNGDIELLASVNSHNKWINIQVRNGVNIVDAFELYEGFSEFVAIDKEHKYLISVHTENVSSYVDQLFVYFYVLEFNNQGLVSFIIPDKSTMNSDYKVLENVLESVFSVNVGLSEDEENSMFDNVLQNEEYREQLCAELNNCS